MKIAFKKKRKKKERTEEGDCKQSQGWKASALAFFGSPKYGEDPVYRDWGVTLIASAVLFCVVFAFGGYIFYDVLNMQELKEEAREEVGSSKVNDSHLDDVLESYKKKQTTFEEVSKNPPEIVDPSI